MLFKDIFEKWYESIILYEYYDASSFFSQADDLSDDLKTCFFELFHVSLVVSGLVIKNDLFLSNFFDD